MQRIAPQLRRSKAMLEIKDSRKAELLEIIKGIRAANRLTPGEAAKIKGKFGIRSLALLG